MPITIRYSARGPGSWEETAFDSSSCATFASIGAVRQIVRGDEKSAAQYSCSFATTRWTVSVKADTVAFLTPPGPGRLTPNSDSLSTTDSRRSGEL